MIEVWRPRPPFAAIPCPDRNFRILTETNADMAMLRSGGDLEVIGFLTIDHVTTPSHMPRITKNGHSLFIAF